MLSRTSRRSVPPSGTAGAPSIASDSTVPTVAVNVCAALRPSGSVAIAVTVATPTATPSSTSTASSTDADDTAGFDDTAE